MKTSLRRIYTKDGIELVGLLYEPEQATDTILVHVHGMSGNFYENPFLDALARKLTNNGVAFFTFNNRGCEIFKDLTQTKDGKKSYVRIGNAYEKFEDCLQDISAAIDAVATLGFTKVHLSGHSLGSPKVTYYATETNDSRLASILLLSPSAMRGLVAGDMERYKADIDEATQLVKSGKGSQLISRPVWDEYPLSAATYLNFFDENTNAGMFKFQDPSDKLTVLAKIRQPLYAVMGRKDDALVASIEETMSKIEAAAVNAPKVKTEILGDANHGYYGYEEKLAEAVYSWIRSV